MTFVSQTFIFFFIASAAAYFASPKKARPGVLLAASLVFYGWAGPLLPVLLAAEALAAWGSGLILEKKGQPGRRPLFIVSLAVLLGPLLVLKYADFFLRAATSGRTGFVLGLAVPAGISFFTFKSLSYVIDVFRGRFAPERNPVMVGAYIAFFPQILAGPIERAGNFLPQLRAECRFDAARAGSGVRLALWGLFKKAVIADRLAQYVNIVFDAPQDHAGLGLIIGLVFYSVQIYADFSGYSDMAIGLARILGFETMDNFRYPYFSRTVAEFWSRWHISLTSWLRDYLFLPISYSLSRRIKGERVLFFKTEYFLYFAGMSATMLLCGLWHGANWTFIVWGAIHGLYLIFSRSTDGLRKAVCRRLGLRRKGKSWGLVRTVFVFSLVTFAWVFFRAPTLEAARLYLSHISPALPKSGIGLLIFLSVLLAVFILAEAVLKNRKALFGERRVPPAAAAVACALFLCLIIILAADTGNEFLYFQF